MFQKLKFLLLIAFGIAVHITSSHASGRNTGRRDIRTVPITNSCSLYLHALHENLTTSASSPVIRASRTASYPSGNNTDDHVTVTPDSAALIEHKIQLGDLLLQASSSFTQDNDRLRLTDIGGAPRRVVSLAGAYLSVMNLKATGDNTSLVVPLSLGYDRFQNAHGAIFHAPHSVLAMSLSYSPTPRLLLAITADTRAGLLRIIDTSLDQLEPLAKRFSSAMFPDMSDQNVYAKAGSTEQSALKSPAQLASRVNQSISQGLKPLTVKFSDLGTGIGNQVRSIYPTNRADQYLLVFDQYIILVNREGSSATPSLLFDLRKTDPVSHRSFGNVNQRIFSDASAIIDHVSWKDDNTLVVEASTFAVVPPQAFESLGLPQGFMHAAIFSGRITSPQLQSSVRFEVKLRPTGTRR